jgi:diguanylate cyclase (GGDEF)-like protein
MNLSDSLAALTVANVDAAQPDVEDVAQRLKRLMDLERLVAEQSAELAWTNERLVAELYDRSAVEASANHLERYDLVTGLPNRRSLEERMSRVLSPLDSTQEPAAVIMVGFERLAEVRETLGYTAGDFVARQVADRLRLTVRGSDLVARVGDDEFALLLTSLRQAEDAGLLARKLYSALVAPLVVAGRELRLEPAVGVAVFPQDGHNGDLLLARADGAMRFAREHRTGLTQFFRPEIALRAARRLSVEADLRAALERDQFRVHFQPRFDLATGRLIGAEAPVRARTTSPIGTIKPVSSATSRRTLA